MADRLFGGQATNLKAITINGAVHVSVWHVHHVHFFFIDSGRTQELMQNSRNMLFKPKIRQFFVIFRRKLAVFLRI